MQSALTIYAGPKALKHIQSNGLNADYINGMVAASGGPKWFILYGLDRYLFGEFFHGRQKPIYTLGSSAGAWQMSCFAQKEPLAAIERLAHLYSNEVYSEKPTAEEISAKARVLLKKVLGDSGAKEIAENPVIHTHILANRCCGLVASESKNIQLAGLAMAAGFNVFSRKSLGRFFERVVFHSRSSSNFDFNDFTTHNVMLTQANVGEALMATGSIPLVLEGVRDVVGAPEGIYRDGGIIDYHLDLPFSSGEGLVLYPHFASRVTPGWFDKKLKYRKVNSEYYDNVVLLTPSDSFVSQLPYGKISDRNDFKNFDVETRQKYWKTVLSESERLADEFRLLVETGEGLDKVKPFVA